MKLGQVVDGYEIIATGPASILKQDEYIVRKNGIISRKIIKEDKEMCNKSKNMDNLVAQIKDLEEELLQKDRDVEFWKKISSEWKKIAIRREKYCKYYEKQLDTLKADKPTILERLRRLIG